MIPSWPSRSPGLTWLTTSGTSGSIRHALELSMTVQPRFAASGASSLLVPPPALNSAMSTPSNASGVARPTVWSVPPTFTTRPALRADARSRSSVIGSCFSRRTWIIVRPTAPVAPTTATTREFGLVRGTVRPASDRLSGTAGVYQRAPSNSASGERRIGGQAGVATGVGGVVARASGRSRGRPEAGRELRAHRLGDLDELARGRRAIPVPVPHERDPAGLEGRRQDRDQRVRRVDGEQRHERAAEARAGHRLDRAVVLGAEHEVRAPCRRRGAGSRPSACSGRSGTR